MKLYNAVVRLGGSTLNEVQVGKITAAEIAVLQRIHGDDGVAKITEVGSVSGRSDAKERARLASIYVKGLSADGKTPLEGVSFIASIFGVGSVPLPHEYVAPVVSDDLESEDVITDEKEVEEVLATPVPIRKTMPRNLKKVAEDANSLVA